MNHRTKVLAAVGLTVLLFLGVQLGALALIEPFDDSGRQAVEDPENPTNSVVYFAILLVATGFMLAAFKYDLDWVIRLLIVGVSVMISWYVFAELVPAAVGPFVSDGVTSGLVIAASIAVGAALLWHPEWYVIDTAGVLMGAGAAALFGISFGLLPALLLLTVLAVYDAISVYGTEHMLDLAEGVMDLKIPVVLVVPTTLSYSFLEPDSRPATLEDDDAGTGGTDTSTDTTNADALENGGRDGSDAGSGTDVQDTSLQPDPNAIRSNDDDANAGGSDTGGEADGDFDRDALFIGLGDAVIPTIIVVSAAFFLEAGTIDVPLLTLNLPALGAMVGTIAGLLVLLWMVLKGRAHAGLPLLNGGAIGGYLLGALASGVSIAAALGF